MLDKPTQNKIDKLWTSFWSGGITNPLTVIEQITFLMFSRLLDHRETLEEKKANRIGKVHNGIFSENEQPLRWKNFKNLSGEELLELVRDKVFPKFRNINGGTGFNQYMKDAQLMIQKPSLLTEAIETIDQLPLTKEDTKGDIYEYLLSKLTTAGIAGQFRTPRHIIDMMVELMNPQPNEKIADPSCGSAGFLVSALKYIYKNNTSEKGIILDDDGEKHYSGDQLLPYQDHIQNHLLTGFDFDSSMLRISAMNLMLHGIDNPQVYYQDSLSQNFKEAYPKLVEENFDLILANPPFKGSIDWDDVDPGLTGKVKTRKTELLFVTLMLQMLVTGGRCATIVPDGVLFGSSNAHKDLRKMLIENNQLEGIVSLPSGVFKPYAGVSTAILIFTKGGKTDKVWFYDVANDGYSLDDKREEIEGSNIPDVIEKWQQKEKLDLTDRKEKCFYVHAKEIVDNDYDLSVNRYKEIVHEEEEYEEPKVILEKIEKIENDIVDGIQKLKELI